MGTESIAFAYPNEFSALDFALSAAGFAEARVQSRPLEVRIGVGPLVEPVPLRIVGYAASVARTINTDLAREMRTAPVRLHLFSSAPKAVRKTPAESDIRALLSLGIALRIVGVADPIFMELASPEDEVSSDLEIVVDRKLYAWLNERAEAHGAEGPLRFRYAIEHAAASMFGDLLSDQGEVPLRVTIGGATEGRFFAFRCQVRRAALAAGLPVAPCAALIIKALRRPWYQPTAKEPTLEMMSVAPAAAVAAMEDASNPTRGGNSGLKSEARALIKHLDHPLIPSLISASTCARSAMRIANEMQLQIGPRLVAAGTGI